MDDIIVLNLPKPEELFDSLDSYQNKQKQLFEKFKAEREIKITKYVKDHLQEWMMSAIEKMSTNHLSSFEIDCKFPCDVVFKSKEHTDFAYIEGNMAHSYKYVAIEILIDVMNRILNSFNATYSDKNRGYYACLSHSRNYLYSIECGDRSYHFDSYSSCTLKDVYDGFFKIRMYFALSQKIKEQ